MFENILLEQTQKELLAVLVEAARKLQRTERRRFRYTLSSAGHVIRHPGLPNGSYLSYITDINALVREGLIEMEWTDKYSASLDVTPRGFKYYSWMRQQDGEPVHHIETHTRSLLDEASAQSHAEAYAKWREAESKLWESDSERAHTVIGHLCREAVQTLVSQLIADYDVGEVDPDPAKTVRRMKCVLKSTKPNTSKTCWQYLDALLSYWGATMDLIQRQEHGAQKEGEELLWLDSRRVVFNTAFLMLEINSVTSSLQRRKK
jgi:hypothetical protein